MLKFSAFFILLDKSDIGKGGIWKLLPEGEEYLKKGAPIGDKRGKHDNHYKKICVFQTIL